MLYIHIYYKHPVCIYYMPCCVNTLYTIIYPLTVHYAMYICYMLWYIYMLQTFTTYTMLSAFPTCCAIYNYHTPWCNHLTPFSLSIYIYMCVCVCIHISIYRLPHAIDILCTISICLYWACTIHILQYAIYMLYTMLFTCATQWTTCTYALCWLQLLHIMLYPATMHCGAHLHHPVYI